MYIAENEIIPSTFSEEEDTNLSNYRFPPLSLLKKYDSEEAAVDMAEVNDYKETIIRVFRSFGIEIDSISTTVGPAITLCEIKLAVGMRISKIKNLEDEISSCPISWWSSTSMAT